MLSHDNFIFTCKSTDERNNRDQPMRVVSYLPLSHAAGQFIDIYVSLMSGNHVFFADPSALTGSLIQTLQEVRPEAFFSVPRVWEKIYEKMMEVSRENTGVLAKIGMRGGIQGPGPRASVRRVRSWRREACRQASNLSWRRDWSTTG
jgi:long-chain-fatty-acid--CoA ligase ACSBG